MRKFLKQLRKGLRGACVTAALATCWNVGQSVAQASYSEGDPVRLEFSGAIAPTQHDLSHVYFIFCTGASSWRSDFQAFGLGSFSALQQGTFSFETDALYYENELYCIIAGLYGDLSSGQYTNGVNGVTLNAEYNPQKTWNDFVFCSESQLFGYLLNGDVPSLTSEIFNQYRFGGGSMEGTITGDLYDFSEPSYNGTASITTVIVPEPLTILLLGSGGVVILGRKKSND